MSNNFENKSRQGKSEPDNDDEFEEMEVEEDADENASDDTETGGEITDITANTDTSHKGHRRRRVKIKKRIRVKKKTSSKRKYKKVFERIIWIAFIVGFITVLYILFNQLGINDEKYKSTKKRSMFVPFKGNNTTMIVLLANKQNPHAGVNSI